MISHMKTMIPVRENSEVVITYPYIYIFGEIHITSLIYQILAAGGTIGKDSTPTDDDGREHLTGFHKWKKKQNGWFVKENRKSY